MKNTSPLGRLGGTLILFNFLFILTASASLKTEADTLYQQEKYDKAAQKYEQIINTKGTSADVYYNLGNAYYKMDAIPQAILYYERAYQLNPGDKDIRNNLAIARGKTIDRVTPPSEMFFVTWWHNFVESLSLNAWGIIGIASFVLALIGVLVYLLTYAVTVRKVGFYSAVVLFCVCVLANVAAWAQYDRMENHSYAIVMSSVVSVKSSPSDNSTDLFVIHEGSKVEILDSTLKDWREVKFEEGKQGWLPASSIEEI